MTEQLMQKHFLSHSIVINTLDGKVIRIDYLLQVIAIERPVVYGDVVPFLVWPYEVTRVPTPSEIFSMQTTVIKDKNATV